MKCYYGPSKRLYDAGDAKFLKLKMFQYCCSFHLFDLNVFLINNDRVRIHARDTRKKTTLSYKITTS